MNKERFIHQIQMFWLHKQKVNSREKKRGSGLEPRSHAASVNISEHKSGSVRYTMKELLGPVTSGFASFSGRC
jgi:hypothetical protein